MLTTERMAEIAKLAIRLQQIRSCAAVTSSGETVLHHTHVDEILSALHDVTAELLANREAQPVERVTADNMQAICMEANRHLGKYSVMAKEVNKLLNRRPLTAPPAPAVPDNLAAAVNRLLDCDGTRGHFSAIRCSDAREEVERLLAQPVSSGYKLPDGWKLVPLESTDAWAERYCELTNKHPDGGLTTYIGDGAVTITFREKSKREIDAMLAAAPEGGNG